MIVSKFGDSPVSSARAPNGAKRGERRWPIDSFILRTFIWSALRDAELAELIGNVTRRAFVRIVDLCLNEQVDALLIAGDLYDGDQISIKTARFLAEQLRRLPGQPA